MTLLIALSVFLIHPSHAQDPEPVDTSIALRCDDFFQPAGCLAEQGPGLGGGAKENVRGRLGMVISDEAEVIPMPIQRRVIRLNEPPSASLRPMRRRPLVEAGGAPVSIASAQQSAAANTPDQLSVNENPNGDGDSGGSGEKDNQWNTSSYGGNSSSGASAGTALPRIGVDGGVKTVGGMVYADDEPSPFEKVKPMAVAGQVSPSNLSNTLPSTGASAVAANRQMDSGANGGDSGDPSAFPGAGAASGTAGFGAPSGGGVPAGSSSTGAVSGAFSKLQALAKALGEKFMSTSGSGGGIARSRAQQANAQRRGVRTGRNGKGQLRATAGLDRDLLKDRYQRHRRDTANSLEFGASNSFMFHDMCEHYANYARRHRIPYHIAGCPSE